MKIIISGGTGFIGSYVLEEAINKNWDIIIVLRKNSDTKRIDPFLNKLTIISSDEINNPAIIEKLQNTDSWVHLSWGGVFNKDRDSDKQLNNIEILTYYLRIAKKIKVKQFIGIGSQAEYGSANKFITETAVTNPTTFYGKTKLSAKWLTQGFCEISDINWCWLRVFSTYGPGDNPNWFIPYIINSIKNDDIPKLTKCEQKWDYLYVTDAAKAIIKCVEHKCSGLYNLASGEIVTLKKIVEIILKKMGRKITPHYGALPYRPDQVMFLGGDVSKLKEKANWAPQVTLEKGLDETINYFLKSKDHE